MVGNRKSRTGLVLNEAMVENLRTAGGGEAGLRAELEGFCWFKGLDQVDLVDIAALKLFDISPRLSMVSRRTGIRINIPWIGNVVESGRGAS